MAMHGQGFRFDLQEASGALGDLGTLLPLTLGMVAVAGLAPVPALAGFGLAYVAAGLWYRLPIPVQPMKAVAAVVLTVGATPEALALAGVMIGAILLLLGATGWIDRLGRLVPQSVLAGLQLGLGLGLAVVGVGLIASAPVLGGALVVLLAVLLRVPRCPAALVVLGLALLVGQVVGVATLPVAAGGGQVLPLAALPSWETVEQTASVLVLPQLALTLTNAVLLTALIAGDCFGAAARHVTPRALSVSTGLGNLLLAPFGALPMCHGAGGVAAHHRFGARSGGAPIILGGVLLAVALAPGGRGIALVSALPVAALGALLVLAALELAMSRRLFDCRPSCYPVIAATAAVTLAADPFWGLIAGTGAEAVRIAAVRRLRRNSR